MFDLKDRIKNNDRYIDIDIFTFDISLVDHVNFIYYEHIYNVFRVEKCGDNGNGILIEIIEHGSKG